MHQKPLKVCNSANFSISPRRLFRVPKMIMLKDLKEVSLIEIKKLNRDTFAEFINNNPKLEELSLQNVKTDLIDLLDGRLNMLKTLKYSRNTNFTTNLPQIRLNSLETLTLCLPKAKDYIRFLRAMNGNQIKTLNLQYSGKLNANDDLVNKICSFKMLNSLEWPWSLITANELRKLAAHLPHLTEFYINIAESDLDLEEKIHSMLSILTKLTKLSIRVNDVGFQQVLKQLISPNEFYARFARANTEIKLTNGVNMVSIAQDRLIVFKRNSLEIYWMDNLDEKNVQKLVNDFEAEKYDGSLKKLKFINNCANCSFDITALAFAGTCLNFKSNGQSLSIQM